METSPLASLPPELRNAIYTHLFTPLTTYAHTLRPKAITHPISQTCRQLRRETQTMYFSSIKFNAHLDDGPITPLAQWLKAIGRTQCEALREVNVWDMHMLQGTLYGVERTKVLLSSKVLGDGEAMGFVLQELEVDGKGVRQSWFLKEIMLALNSIGLTLARFCVVDSYYVSGTSEVLPQVKETSWFAIVGLRREAIDGSTPNVHDVRASGSLTGS